MADLPYPDKARKPIQGVRLRFRTAVRKAGIRGKFGTAFLRSVGKPSLLCFCSDAETLDAINKVFSSWEGYTVRTRLGKK